MHFFGFFKTQECKTNHSQGIPGHRSPAAAAYTNVLVRMLLRKCNGDARKKLLEPTFLNTLRSSHNILNCVNLTTRFVDKYFYVDFLLTYSNSFPHHRNYSSMRHSEPINNHYELHTQLIQFFNSFSGNLYNSPITTCAPLKPNHKP